jgi:hypothetical protein
VEFPNDRIYYLYDSPHMSLGITTLYDFVLTHSRQTRQETIFSSHLVGKQDKSFFSALIFHLSPHSFFRTRFPLRTHSALILPHSFSAPHSFFRTHFSALVFRSALSFPHSFSAPHSFSVPHSFSAPHSFFRTHFPLRTHYPHL